MEQQIQKEKRMEQNKGARIADYINPQKLRIMQLTTTGRDDYPGSRFTSTLITHHMERNPWHVPDALDVGRN